MSGPWQHRSVEANGIRLHLVEQGQGFPVVLCHGFPELWYSWRHQIPALAAAGLRAIAPDLRGYGESDKPREIAAYDIHHLVGDLLGLLDALGLEKAAFVGHDWGAVIIWQLAVMHPERVERLVSLNVPYLGRAGLPPTEVIKNLPDGRFNYVLFFQEPGKAEGVLEPDLEASLGRIVRMVAANPDFLQREELLVYVEAFRRGGLSGPLNYYRNIDRNWETTTRLAEKQVLCPVLLIMAEKDPILSPFLAEGMGRWVPNLRKALIKDCGHWTQQERPEEVNALLIDFLADLAER